MCRSSQQKKAVRYLKKFNIFKLGNGLNTPTFFVMQ
eukprot:UN01066